MAAAAAEAPPTEQLSKAAEPSPLNCRGACRGGGGGRKSLFSKIWFEKLGPSLFRDAIKGRDVG